MTVQIVEIAGQKMAVLPIADYERLMDAAEDRRDDRAAADAETRRLEGEGYLPSGFVDRILRGESALRCWREFRGLTQSKLADSAGLSTMMVSTLELGKRNGNANQWRALADALASSVNDLMPAR